MDDGQPDVISDNHELSIDEEVSPDEDLEDVDGGIRDNATESTQSKSDSNIAKIVAEVVRTSASMPSVIQCRKRTISAAVIRGATTSPEMKALNGRTAERSSEISQHPGKSDDGRKRLRIMTETSASSLGQHDAAADEKLQRRNTAANDHTGQLKAAERMPLKSFLCPYCETRFSNPNTLEAHQAIYCMRKPIEKASSPNAGQAKAPVNTPPPVLQASQLNAVHADTSEQQSTSSKNRVQPSARKHSQLLSPDLHLMTNLASNAPSVILLPCGYNRSNSIQVMGKPQLVIPVAVPKSFTPSEFSVSPLLLDEHWCNGVDIPDFSLPLINAAGSQPTPNHVFQLPLGIRSDDSSTSATQRVKENGRCRSPPLDLTKKRLSSGTSSPPFNCNDAATAKRRSLPMIRINSHLDHSTGQRTPTPPQMSSAPLHPKNYACPKCDVAFSSKKTLDGHQAFYCKATKSMPSSSIVNASSPPVQNEQTSSHSQTLNCQYCDQSMATPWLLLQHMKSTHSLGAAYLCTLCGYRGFSVRGMKSHLKHAHVDETASTSADEDDVILRYVRKTRLFDDCDGIEEGDDGSHSTDTRSEIDVDDFQLDKTTTPPLLDVNKRTKLDQKSDRRKYGDQHQRSDDGSSSTVTSTNQHSPTLVSKYECQFCAYKSPYKGNVKRHLALVHKMDKKSGTE